MYRSFGFSLLLLSFFINASIAAEAAVRYRVLCINHAEGCVCENSQNVLYHYEAVDQVSPPKGNTVTVDAGRGLCNFPLEQLEPIPVASEAILSRQPDHTPVPLDALVQNPSSKDQLRSKLDALKRYSLGLFWPTYYHLAREDYHPGKSVPVLDSHGRTIGRASEDFLQQVMWEGSGVAIDGSKYHYTGTNMRFEKYGDTVSWGYGAGYGYQVFPYRTLAGNYPGLCEKLKEIVGTPCGKKQLIGMLVHIPEIEKKKIKIGETVHDGYFCITDTGSPYYIRSDRIDIFVGTHGGGNPYLPESRQSNSLIAGGIRNIVPSDWRLWKTKKDRVWCEESELPANPGHPAPGDCVIDYHVVAFHKALEINAVLDSSGNPIKCAKNPR